MKISNELIVFFSISAGISEVQSNGGPSRNLGGKRGKYSKQGKENCKAETYYLDWTLPLITREGDLVSNAATDASSGERWPFADFMYDKPVGGNAVAFNAELCTRLNDDDLWLCSGTMKDFTWREGQITYEGIYEDDEGGLFTITGGTGAFECASGYISDTFDSTLGSSVCTVKLCGV